jgi:hypothetical protein
LNWIGREEVKEFIEKYDKYIHPLMKSKSIDQNTEEIFADTQGHPIMVRFAVFNEGLIGHVEKMYLEYLQDKDNNNYPHSKRINTIILNSLFDISHPLDDSILNEFALLNIAKQLRNTIIKKSGDRWKTIHLRWDMELIKYMFSLEEYSVEYIENSFSSTVNSIITKQNISSFDTLVVLNTVYYTLIKENVTILTNKSSLTNYLLYNLFIMLK